MSTSRKTTLLLLSVCALVLTFAASAAASSPVEIQAAFVQYDNVEYDGADTITLLGQFAHSGEAIVFLGNVGDASIVALSENTLVAICPGGTCPSGDYLVRVLTSYGEGTYALTLGAVGPEGPEGPAGPQGPAGDPATDTSAATECGMDEVLLGDGSCLSILDLVCLVDAKTVFVTSSRSNGNLGGLAGADAECNARADAAGLTGHYKAWLSDASASPSSRFVPSNCPYYRVDGVRVASDWDDLTDGTLAAPISLDENGVSRARSGFASSELVWTNTDTDGTAIGTDTGATCGDWTLGNGTSGSKGGILDESDNDWTYSPIFTAYCNDQKRLYCIQQ